MKTIKVHSLICITPLIVAYFMCCNMAYANYASEERKSCTLRNQHQIDVQLDDYLGRVVYVDFWASWCPPCIKSFPFMNALHAQYQAQGLTVIAVNLDDNPEDVAHFLRRHHADFMVAFDNHHRDCARHFAVQAMPSSYLLDKQGNVRYVHLGFKKNETESVQATLKQLLEE